MTPNDVRNLLRYIDTEFIPLGVDDLAIILALLDRNPQLLKDYPTLEDARNLIKSKIEIETERINLQQKNLDEIYGNNE